MFHVTRPVTVSGNTLIPTPVSPYRNTLPSKPKSVLRLGQIEARAGLIRKIELLVESWRCVAPVIKAKLQVHPQFADQLQLLGWQD